MPGPSCASACVPLLTGCWFRCEFVCEAMAWIWGELLPTEPWQLTCSAGASVAWVSACLLFGEVMAILHRTDRSLMLGTLWVCVGPEEHWLPP